MLTETRLGRPMDDALADMAERVGSKNLSFVVTAVTIQRQVGGSLAGIFDMVAEAVRNRQQFARKIRALTAMGRAVRLRPRRRAVLHARHDHAAQPRVHGVRSTTRRRGRSCIDRRPRDDGVGSLMLRKIVYFKG